jgi:hypothetical protein
MCWHMTPKGASSFGATRVVQPVKIDGRLDDSVYAKVPPITEFIQSEPMEGKASTEKTEESNDLRHCYLSDDRQHQI